MQQSQANWLRLKEEKTTETTDQEAKLIAVEASILGFSMFELVD
jgi:hypothetical protein